MKHRLSARRPALRQLTVMATLFPERIEASCVSADGTPCFTETLDPEDADPPQRLEGIAAENGRRSELERLENSPELRPHKPSHVCLIAVSSLFHRCLNLGLTCVSPAHGSVKNDHRSPCEARNDDRRRRCRPDRGHSCPLGDLSTHKMRTRMSAVRFFGPPKSQFPQRHPIRPESTSRPKRVRHEFRRPSGGYLHLVSGTRI